jgi:hypothetical protein
VHAGTAYAQTQASLGQPFELLGKCMDLTNGDVTNGTKIQLWDCNGGQSGGRNQPGPNQHWLKFGPPGGAVYSVRPALNTSKCLDLPGLQTANGTPLQIWDCNGGPNQQWVPDPVYNYLQGYGGKCVEAPGFQNANGTILDYWDCNKGSNQQFYLGTYQYCTQQYGGSLGASFQDFKNIDSPPVWNRVYDKTGSYLPGAYCGNSCTYTRVLGKGNYGSCPF